MGPEGIPYSAPQKCSNIAPHCPTPRLKCSLDIKGYECTERNKGRYIARDTKQCGQILIRARTGCNNLGVGGYRDLVGDSRDGVGDVEGVEHTLTPPFTEPMADARGHTPCVSAQWQRQRKETQEHGLGRAADDLVETQSLAKPAVVVKGGVVVG